MKSLILALVAVLGLVASAEAGNAVVVQRVRATPFRPFVGPVVRQRVVVGHHAQAFVAPRFHAQAFVQPLYQQQFVVPHVQQFVAPQVYVQPQQFVAPLQFNGGCAACFR